MSASKISYRFIEFLSTRLRGPITFCQQQLVGQNRRIARDALRLWLMVIWDVRSGMDPVLSNKSFQHICCLLESMDFDRVLSTLDTADQWLLSSVEDSSLRRYASLEGMLSSEEQREFIHTVYALIIPIVRKWFKSSDEDCFRRAHQVFTFMKRVSLDLEVLAEKAEAGWRERERRDPIEVPSDCIEKELLSRWFPKEQFASWRPFFDPHHGSGAVAEIPPEGSGLSASSTLWKWMNLEFSSIQVELLREVGWSDVLSPSTLHRAAPIHRGVGGAPYDLMSSLSKRSLLRREPNTCRVMFVPKTWKTFRTVSCEPAATMWLQQGVGAMVDACLKRPWATSGNARGKDPLLTSFHQIYSIDSEDWNRELAQWGSICGDYATIDLSAASDTVSLDLVDQWFSDTWLDFPLYATRTQYARIGDDLIRQTKFAPMGSRLCFPVESMIFGAIGAAACERNARAIPPGVPPVVVFGDDIVIRKEAVGDCLARLKELGFEVNTSKSFYNIDGPDYFRESCGDEYLNGEDVHAVRISREFIGYSWSENQFLTNPKALAASIQLANNLYGYLPTARLAIVDHLINRCHLPILMDESGERGLRSSTPDNHHLNRGYDDSIQCEDALAIVLTSSASDASVATAKSFGIPASNVDQECCGSEQLLFEQLRLTSRRKGLEWPEDRVDLSVKLFRDPRVSWEIIPL